jgi:nucleoside-diphosphate-sugar epimerase
MKIFIAGASGAIGSHFVSQLVARRFVAQSNYALLERSGGPVADENARIEPNPPKDVK